MFFVGLHGDKTYNILFVETPRKFINAVINLSGVSTNKILYASCVAIA
jgi:hypothetical protein